MMKIAAALVAAALLAVACMTGSDAMAPGNLTQEEREARAAAAGIDVNDPLGGSAMPLPPGFVPPELNCDFAGQFPYMVSVRSNDGEHKCGGALIAPNWVITAAHCVDPRFDSEAPAKPDVNIGGAEDDKPIESIPTNKTIPHEKWKGQLEDGIDVALLRLERDACVMPAFLPLKNDTLPDRMTFLAWGRLSDGGAFSTNLQVGDWAVIGPNECREFEELEEIVSDKMFCGRGRAGNLGGVCVGDDGGPFVWKKNDFLFEDTVYGVASFNQLGCEQDKIPSIFVNVQSILTWVESAMSEP